jgi:hypothetical protein
MKSLLLATSLVLVCSIFLAASELSFDEQLPAGPAKEKAEAACLGCHEARIIVQQRLAKPAWTKEVDKMVKWGADVAPADRDALIDYLSANFPADKAAYEAQGTEVTTGRKTPKTK